MERRVNLTEDHTHHQKKRIKGLYLAHVFAYGKNGTAKVWIAIGDSMFREEDSDTDLVRAEVLKFGFAAREKQIEAHASSRVESCPRDSGPWYWKEGNDGAHIVIVNGIGSIIELFRRLRK